MNIYIVRHGSAEPGAVNDQDRCLTERGQQQAAGAARWIHNNMSSDLRLLVSPYRRAMQTAEAIASECGIQAETLTLLTPDADVMQLTDELTKASSDLILVSHLPLVGHLAAYLVDGQIYDQPWSPAEVWQLGGDVAAAGCMEVDAVWYPVLDGI